MAHIIEFFEYLLCFCSTAKGRRGDYIMNVERINELAKKAKTVGLTEEEKKEQAALRREYIDSVIGNLRGQLDNTYTVDEDGNKERLKKKNEGKKN